MNQVDVPLLRKAVEWVEQQSALPPREREWDQTQWYTKGWDRRASCGTVMCVAGYICQVSGATFVQDGPGAKVTLPGDEHTPMHVSKAARLLLNIINPRQEHGLFNPGNTAAHVRLFAEQLAGEPL